MDYKDYYSIMGVERTATQAEIKRAYRKLARKYHPDVSKADDAEARFKELGEANEVLKNPEKRAAYDQLGANWKEGQDFKPPPGWDAGFEYSGGQSEDEAAAFSDFFESLFGQNQTAPSHGGFSMRGEDHHARILIDLGDAYRGAQRGITLRAPQINNDGHLINRERTLNVKIPKGVKSGQRIRLSGQGSPGLNGSQAGDLYLEIEFKPHRLFQVEQRDITIELPVAPWEAALGATVHVPTPDGAVDLTIPAGSSGGTKLRLKHKGIPGKTPGDLYVKLRISLPPADTKIAQSLYRQMEQQMPFNPRLELEV